MVFPGFSEASFAHGQTTLQALIGGAGPPVLLLHGFPQTRAAWHLVAPILARHFTVIVPDLPAYGRSQGPVPSADGASHSKRAMAGDMIAMMDSLGHTRFAVAGHDRGGRVAYRLALDHPDRVSALAVLDIMTTLDTWEAMDWRDAVAAYHWPFLAQEAQFVERMIGADSEAYLAHLVGRWIGQGNVLDPGAYADYAQAIARPSVIAAMAADYRAGAAMDVQIDQADRAAGRRLACPLTVLRGAQYAPGPLAPAWIAWTADGHPPPEHVFDCGHFLAEEAPQNVARALLDAFGDPTV